MVIYGSTLLSSCTLLWRPSYLQENIYISYSVGCTQGEYNSAQTKRQINVYTFPFIHMKCLSTMLTICLSHANNSYVHIYPWFSLHPDILVLHYSNNRAGNYEKSWLRGFSASARSYLTVVLNLIRGNPDVLVRKSGFFWQQSTRGQFFTEKYKFSHYPDTDVYWGNLVTWNKNTIRLQNH